MKRLICILSVMFLCLSFSAVSANAQAYDESTAVQQETTSAKSEETTSKPPTEITTEQPEDESEQTSEAPPATPEIKAPDIVPLEGKKIMVVGNSMLYFGNCVIKSDNGKADNGYLYQLIKANGENATVIDHTYPSKTLDYIYNTYLCVLSQEELKSYDYVVLSEATQENPELVKTCQKIMALFPETTQFRFMCHPMMYDKQTTSLLDGVQRLRSEGMQIVDWGKMVYDVYTRAVQVPWAENEYDRCTFIKNNIGKKNGSGSISPGIEGDEKHPNPLSGYVAAQMLYTSLTNRSAVLSPYEFCFDSSIHKYFDIDAFAKAHYNADKKTNFPGVFRSATDMFGLQVLMDAYLEAEGKHPLSIQPSVSPTCTTSGLTEGRYCSVCGLVAQAQQTVPGKGGHKLVYCTAVEATCTQNGTTAGIYCNECNTTLLGVKPTQPKGHNFNNYIYNNNATCTLNGTKTAKCDNCNETNTLTAENTALGHKMGKNKTVTAPTCTSKGMEKSLCERCEHFTTHEIPALNHQGAYTVGQVNPTCIQKGMTAGIYCDKCDTWLEGRKAIAAKGHSYSKYVSDKNATYFSDGTKTAECKNCNEKKAQTDKGSKLILGKPSKVTASADSTFVTLKWKKVTGATGYRVYIYRSGSWKKLKDVSALSYKVTGLKSLTQYRFSVRPFAKSGKKYAFAPQGERVTVTTILPAVSIKVSSPSKSKLKVSWKDIKNESGYQLWYTTKQNGTFKKLVNCKANTISFTKSGLKKGKTYYLKVRSYTRLNGKYVYSKYSAVKSVKIK